MICITNMTALAKAATGAHSSLSWPLTVVCEVSDDLSFDMAGFLHGPIIPTFVDGYLPADRTRPERDARVDHCATISNSPAIRWDSAGGSGTTK
jgi:hypothetical protein